MPLHALRSLREIEDPDLTLFAAVATRLGHGDAIGSPPRGEGSRPEIDTVDRPDVSTLQSDFFQNCDRIGPPVQEPQLPN
jgi:hypothetical protein